MRLCITYIFVALCGCSSNPWMYNPAPGSGAMGVESAQKPVILLGAFTSGAGVDARWSDIALQMQESFSRALIKTGNFDVVTDRHVAENAQTAFFIEAKITDFLHTSEAPDSVRRLSWFSKANDAVVALDITATEIRTGRVVLSDQMAATVSVGNEETDQYGALEFGSYLFWSTPLGQASTDVIDDSIAQIAKLRGSMPGSVTITKYTIGNREVKLSAGDVLDGGGIYYVGTQNPKTRAFVAVEDDLGRPLRLRVEHHFWSESSGWLLAEPAEHEAITGATLSKSPLPAQNTLALEPN